MDRIVQAEWENNLKPTVSDIFRRSKICNELIRQNVKLFNDTPSLDPVVYKLININDL